jgi:hypothetical protein
MLFLLSLFLTCSMMLFQCIFIFAHPDIQEGVGNYSFNQIVVLASLSLIVALLGIISVGRLVKVHIVNFLTGKTSSERFSRSSMMGSRLTRYSFRNCLSMCCNIN